MRIEILIDTKLARVKTSYEVYGVSRPTYTNAPAVILGLPDTWQYQGLTVAENNHVVLTEPLQRLWYSENVKLTPYMTEEDHWKSFNSLTADDRYITNGAGSDTHRVYPTGRNPDAEDMRYFTLLTANAVIELTGETRNIAGIPHSEFWCIDASKIVDIYTLKDHPHKWYWPAISNRVMMSNGKWYENKETYFPQFDGKAIAPLFMPNTDRAWILSDLLVRL